MLVHDNAPIKQVLVFMTAFSAFFVPTIKESLSPSHDVLTWRWWLIHPACARDVKLQSVLENGLGMSKRDKSTEDVSRWSKAFIQNMENLARAVWKDPSLWIQTFVQFVVWVWAADGKERKNNMSGQNNGNNSDVKSANPDLSPVCLLLFRTVCMLRVNLCTDK